MTYVVGARTLVEHLKQFAPHVLQYLDRNAHWRRDPRKDGAMCAREDEFRSRLPVHFGRRPLEQFRK